MLCTAAKPGLGCKGCKRDHCVVVLAVLAGVWVVMAAGVTYFAVHNMQH